jgi:AcrR family transcriptional regulator
MPKRVDHDRRREYILLKALAVFQERGVAEANFSEIAERARVSRPMLYRYFKDKDELFHDAIKHVTDLMLQRFLLLASREGDDALARLRAIFEALVDDFIAYRKLLRTLFDYLVGIRRSHEEFSRFMSRRTIQMKRLFFRLAVEGKASGAIAEPDAGAVVRFLLALVQTLFIQIANLPPFSAEHYKRVTRLCVESLKEAPLEKPRASTT